jgi:hypothetical protein
MTFQDLDSNFEKKVQETNNKNQTPEEQHLNNTNQSVDEKPKYENVMGNQLGGGLLSVFQDKLQSVRKPTDPSDSYDTLTVTSNDITRNVPSPQSPQTEVSEEQINSLLKEEASVTPTQDTSSKSPIQDKISSDDIQIVSSETQTKGATHTFEQEQKVEEVVTKVKHTRYEDTHPVQDKMAKEDDAISQIAVLRAANGEATSLGTDGKTMEDDYVAYQIQQHRAKKEEARLKGDKMSAESVVSLNNENDVQDAGDISGPSETILTEDDI